MVWGMCDPDIDADGIDNESDNCPASANATQEDLDEDGEGDLCDSDIDGDGVPQEADSSDAALFWITAP